MTPSRSPTIAPIEETSLCPRLAVSSIFLQALLPDAPAMFVISEEEAAAIRTAFDQGGEFAATVELRCSSRIGDGLVSGDNQDAIARDMQRGAGLRSLAEPSLDTTGDSGVGTVMAGTDTWNYDTVNSEFSPRRSRDNKAVFPPLN